MLTLVLVAVGIASRDMQSLNRIIISIRTNMRKHHIKSWILLKPGTKKENVGVAMSPMKHSLKVSGWRPDNLLDWCAMQALEVSLCLVCVYFWHVLSKWTYGLKLEWNLPTVCAVRTVSSVRIRKGEIDEIGLAAE
jgi:hypothetical protein